MKSLQKLQVCLVCAIGVMVGAGTAEAQYGTVRIGDPPPGEDYHVELSFSLWRPSADIIFASESLGIVGTNIDGVNDLGWEKKDFGQFRAILRPGRQHKFRVERLPITYDGDEVLEKNLIFNGILFPIRIPVQSEYEQKIWTVGYEYDFVYRDWGYAGFIFDLKYTKLRGVLTSPIDTEFSEATIPIPTIGGAIRVYPAKFLSVTGEVTGMQLTIDADSGHYWDINIYGTVSFGKYVGGQLGYRWIDLQYVREFDAGDSQLKGFYFGGVVRF
jgi:hypothetical protein